MEFRERRRTTVTSVDVVDALEGERELDGTGMARPDLDDEEDEHANPRGFGREAAWPAPERSGRVAQVGCDQRLSGPPDPRRPAPVVSPSDQLAWQQLGGAAAKQTGR